MATRAPRVAVLRFVLLVAVLVGAAIAFAATGGSELQAALETVANSRWGIVGFIALYMLVVVSFAPGTAATVAAAGIFGFATGFAVAMVGASAGATLSFLIARQLGRDGAIELLGDRLARIDQWLDGRDFQSVLVLRLLPIVPFNGLNYAAGLSGLRLMPYVIGTILGIAPGTALTSWTASQAMENPTGRAFFLGLGLSVAALAVSALVARRAISRRGVGSGA